MDRLLPQGLQKLFEKTSFSNTTILKTFFSHTKNIIHILLLFKMITVLSALQRMTPKCGNNSNKPFFLLSIMNINQHTILNCPHPFFHSLRSISQKLLLFSVHSVLSSPRVLASDGRWCLQCVQCCRSTAFPTI